MATTELQQMIDVVAKDKGIDPSIVIGAIEDAYLAASRKVFKGDEDLRTRFNLETGQVELYAVRLIVTEVANSAKEISLDEARGLYGDEAEVGMEIEFPKETEKLGRIAAQTAKQVIAQRVREAEREKIHGEFSQRIGEVVNAMVKRFESGDIIAEIGRVEAQIPRKEQSRAENYAIGDRVRAVIKAVTKNAKGPQLVLSRTDPRLLIRLFEMEVPEIYDGTVVIKGAVRQPGERAKVAVRSRERDVDPVGACVGMRGSRVQSIMRELHGEKIDVILYSDDLITFAQNALAPAKITRVSPIHHEDGGMSLDCVVEDDQLSLAIGKKGQNVRLASALIGMKIEIKGETEVKGEVAQALSRMLEASKRRQTPVGEIEGIGEKTAERLVEAGVATLGDLLEKSAAELAELPGIGEKSAEKILEAARALESAPAVEEDEESDGGDPEEETEAEAPEETGVRE